MILKGAICLSQINIRIDDSLKKQGEDLFRALGISFSSAVSMFVSQAVRQGGIPFEITTNVDPFYSAANQRHLREAIERVESGRFTIHELIEAEEDGSRK